MISKPLVVRIFTIIGKIISGIIVFLLSDEHWSLRRSARSKTRREI